MVMSGCVDMAPKLEEQCVLSSLALKIHFKYQFSNTTSTSDNSNVVMRSCIDMAPQLGKQCAPSSLALMNEFHFSVQ